MNATRLQELVRKLELPQSQFVLFGGTVLAALNIRDAKDIDIFVDDLLFEQLIQRGWQKKSEQQRSPYLLSEIDGIPIQAFNIWEGGDWEPNIAGYMADPEVISGLSFMPLLEIYNWKVATRRPKDLEDIVLIENYWARKNNPK